jgi:putative nucleotidyltransferase with HDIG domain
VARESDVVCRYGGEEFAILMPGVDIEEAAASSESIRVGISELQFPGFRITASFGLSAYSLGATDPHSMLDQADKCLYVAKRNGRNKVFRFDTVPTELLVDESKISRTKLLAEEYNSPTIPYPAVTALLSALTFRDLETGMHSNRVSTYAALLAQRILGPKEVYVVEIAALLHDIGKVGVPDAILLKPGPLTSDEWELMEKHDRIGVEIISRSFKHQGLTDVVKHHHSRFDGGKCREQSLRGEEIPIGARILTIVDSFDAMVSDRTYRKGMSISKAIEELRRCSGTQFDPVLVEYFVEIIESGALQIAQRETCTGEVMLAIGEQVERLVDAADVGDGATFVALADRLRQTAEKHQISTISNAASRAIDMAKNEDEQVENLVRQSFELLAVCRELRANLSTTLESESADSV